MAASSPSPRSARKRGRPTEKQRLAYLDGLRNGLSHRQAAERAGRDRDAFKYLRRVDPEFAAAADDAYEDGCDPLEEEAWRRGHDGVDDVKMIGQGQYAERVEFRNYSDRLLELLMKARRPHRYRENVRTEHVGGDGPPIQTETTVKGVALSDVLDFARSVGAAPSGDD